MKTKVTLVDDDENQARAWKSSLEEMRLGGKSTGKKKLDIQLLSVDGRLKECVEELTRRRGAARDGENIEEASSSSDREASRAIDEIDTADIFLIDYDLLGRKNGVAYTGEDVAYLARCYSTCKVIVAINQFTTENVFDLNLTGYPASYADLNITADQLANPGLWHSPWVDAFRPWYWPVLPDLVSRFDSRVRFVHDHIDVPMLEALGFAEDLVQMFPRTVEAFLDPRNRRRNLPNITFRTFVQNSGNGLRPKDKLGKGEEANDRVCRIAAARISRWLEDLVLSGQEILIDAPHLLARHAGFLHAKSTTIQGWNKSAHMPSFDPAITEPSPEELLGLNTSLADYRFLPAFWMSRSAWIWPRIVANGERFGPERSSTNFVFCEDTSRFAKREDARQFAASVDSAQVRRYVSSGIDGISYRPDVRLSS